MSAEILDEKIYFITAIGTDLGKTFLVENLCKKLQETQNLVHAIKPVASGFNDDDLSSDCAKILKVLGKSLSEENFNSITPWRFKAPISPHLAAKAENKKIDFLEVVNFCRKEILQAQKENKFLLIEAAGGVMTPISDDKNFLDLIAELKIPTLLLSANYLGAISHTLCAIEALKSKNILIEKVIINDHFLNGDPSFAGEMSDMISTIENFSKIKTVSINVFLD